MNRFLWTEAERRIWCCLAMVMTWAGLAAGGSAVGRASAPAIPEDFPRFLVPGHEAAMDSLRKLYHLHYQPPAGPLATMWDEWMAPPTLWPAVTTGNRMHALRRSWAQALATRHMDPEGYVATHQHASIAHQHGWPFPFWKQGCDGVWGWHFAIPGLPPMWHATQTRTQEAWELVGGADRGIADHAWNIELTAPEATVQAPPLYISPYQSPFIQLRWRAKGLDHAQPFIEWTTADEPAFSPANRYYFAPVTEAQGVVCTMIPVYRSPAWQGTITQLRINFDNAAAGATVGIQGLFTQYDTRHNINNTAYIQACSDYFLWTRDLNFLRNNIGRIRTAMLYLMTELGGHEHKCVVTPWVGHCGRSGLELTPDGRKIIHCGRGIGHNYWDLLPFGRQDTYATMRYYDALRRLAALEREITAHPEWNIPGGPLRQSPADLLAHAEEVKAHAGQLFWNESTGRFVTGIDVDGRSYDYGLTFLNCDAIHYDFATDEQARSIMDWITGERIVSGDTSQGADIYRWRFGPRSTTLRNIEYYFWAWSGPETIPWGGQVQDGGAVLGWSYHDLMARLRLRGPDDAWQRLREVIGWYDDVQAAGGYREYYKEPERGTLQGAGTAGGLGCDQEFFESILVPQIVLDGFLGFRPRADGFQLDPRLPGDWPELTVTRIHLHRHILDVKADGEGLTITASAGTSEPLTAYLPAGRWRVAYLALPDAFLPPPAEVTVADDDNGIPLLLPTGATVRLLGPRPPRG